MLKQLELSNPKSCLNKARADEPVFVLRAKDRLAAMTVRHWIAMSEGLHEPDKLEEAEELAQKMEEWRAENDPEVAAPYPEVVVAPSALCAELDGLLND